MMGAVHRLDVFSRSGLGPKRLLATVWRQGGLSFVRHAEPRLGQILESLLKRDLDEPVGFPPRRLRALRGSERAFLGIADVLRESMGLEVVVRAVPWSATASIGELRQVAEPPVAPAIMEFSNGLSCRNPVTTAGGVRFPASATADQTLLEAAVG